MGSPCGLIAGPVGIAVGGVAGTACAVGSTVGTVCNWHGCH